MAKETATELGHRFASALVKAAETDASIERISEAVFATRTKTASSGVSKKERSTLSQVLRKLGTDLESRVYADSDTPISEQTKENLCEEVAKALEGKITSKKIRHMLKEASLDNFVVVTQDIEDFYQAILND